MPHQLAISTSRQVGGPAPRRAPLPRRRVRRGCADPAPPAGPSGAAGSGQPLGTLRSPPRPRGGANRAGERAPPLPQYNSQRGGSGSTEIWPLTNFWPGSIYIVLRWSLIPSYNRQNALVNFSLRKGWVGGFQGTAAGSKPLQRASSGFNMHAQTTCFRLSPAMALAVRQARHARTHQQPCSHSHRSASIAAIAPVPAEVMA